MIKLGDEEFTLEGMNVPTDNDMTKKHVPDLEAPKRVKAGEPFTLKIKVGGFDGVEHPSLLGHWINWVVLYAGLRPVARVYFYPPMTDGYEVTLQITLEKTTIFVAQAWCNLHGLWESHETEVSVIGGKVEEKPKEEEEEDEEEESEEKPKEEESEEKPEESG